jgi:hypothetical protein
LLHNNVLVLIGLVKIPNDLYKWSVFLLRVMGVVRSAVNLGSRLS